MLSGFELYPRWVPLKGEYGKVTTLTGNIEKYTSRVVYVNDTIGEKKPPPIKVTLSHCYITNKIIRTVNRIKHYILIEQYLLCSA